MKKAKNNRLSTVRDPSLQKTPLKWTVLEEEEEEEEGTCAYFHLRCNTEAIRDGIARRYKFYHFNKKRNCYYTFVYLIFIVLLMNLILNYKKQPIIRIPQNFPRQCLRLPCFHFGRCKSSSNRHVSRNFLYKVKLLGKIC